MGQYYMIVNVDKKEYISPHDFDCGMKLMEFANPVYTGKIMSALAILLADGNGRGCGDLHSNNPIIGSWKFNRIVVAGDYADPVNPDLPEEQQVSLYHIAQEEYTNVSIPVLLAMADDSYTAEKFAEYWLENYKFTTSTPIYAMAYAHKLRQYKDSFYGEGINKYPNLAICAEQFFTKLFPDKDSNYYKVINGIVKHDSRRGEEDLLEFESICKDFLENSDKQAKIDALKLEISKLNSELDKLTK